MVKAILIPVQYQNIQDIANCLKTSKLLTPSTRLINTIINASTCSALGTYLKLTNHPQPDFSSPEMLKIEVLRGKDSVYIESKYFIKQIVLDLGLITENANFHSALCVIDSQDNHASKLKAKFIYLPDFPSYIPDLDPENNDEVNDTLQVVKQEFFDYFLRSSQLTIKAFESVKTNSILSMMVVREIEGKLRKIEGTVQENQARAEPKNEKILEAIGNFGAFRERVRNLSNEVRAISELINLKEPDFGQVEAPFVEYKEGAIEWGHRRSEDNSSHVFTLKNLTQGKLNKVSIYNSDDEQKMCCVDIEAFESVEVSCDLLIDQLKLLGKIEFDVFYCCYKLAASISIYCIEILNIEKFQTENNRFILNYQCSVTSLKGLQLMHNDVVLVKSTSTKNFENGKLVFSIRDFKGEVVLYFLKDNKLASNRFSLTV